VQLSVTVDLKGFNRAMDSLAKDQIPFATAYALTQTAKLAQREVENAMPRYLDRPTPFTRRAVWTRSATKRRLLAEVAIKDGKATAAGARDAQGKPIKQLGHQVEGGTRPYKQFELLLQSRGMMPRGWYSVAGKDIPKDQYGNIPSGIINRVLSQLQAHSVYNMDRNESAASKARQFKSRTKRLARYFVVMPGGHPTLIPGIWERTSFGFGASIRPLFIYVQAAPKYRKRLPFNQIVQRTVEKELAGMFWKGMQVAQATAKPRAA
jgi:hypothetical protein